MTCMSVRAHSRLAAVGAFSIEPLFFTKLMNPEQETA